MARTKEDSAVLSVHRTRAKAREQEGDTQQLLDDYWKAQAVDPTSDAAVVAGDVLDLRGIPRWAHGVKVERVGNLIRRWVQFGVIATSDRGH